MPDTTPYPIPRQARQTSILVGNGTAGPYGPFAFGIFDIEDVVVYRRDEGDYTFATAAVTVAKVSGQQYDFFTVTFPAPIPVTTSFVVSSERTPERSAGVLQGTRVGPDALEKEFSKIATAMQELRRDIDRAIRAPFSQEPTELPGPEAERVLGWRDGSLVNIDPAAFVNDAGFATAVQGGKADSALQPVDDEANVLGLAAVSKIQRVYPRYSDDTSWVQNQWDDARSRGRYVDMVGEFAPFTKSALEALPDYGLKPPSGSRIDLGNAKLSLQPGVDVRHIIAGTAVSDVRLYDLDLDGNGSAANGVGFSGATNFRLANATIRNIRSAPQSYTTTVGLGGGRAVTFQYACRGVFINDLAVYDSFAALDLVGTSVNPSHGLVCRGLYAENCDFIVELLGNESVGLAAARAQFSTTVSIVSDIVFKNCGRSTQDHLVNFSFIRQNTRGNCFPWMSPARAGTTFAGQDWLMVEYNAGDPEWSASGDYAVNDRVRMTNDGTFGALFGFDHAAGMQIRGVRGFNEDSYGAIGAIARGMGKNITLRDVEVNVHTRHLYRFGPVPALSVATRQNEVAEQIRADITNLGITETVVDSDGPVGGTSDYSIPNVHLVARVQEDVSTSPAVKTALIGSNLGSVAPGKATPLDYKSAVEIHNIQKGGKLYGTFGTLRGALITDVNSANADAFKTLITVPLSINVRESVNQLRLGRNTTNVGDVSIAADANGMFINKSLRVAGTNARKLSGAGSPEGVVAAPVGSEYTRTDGTAGATFYVKETGAGTTGWVAK